MSNYYIICNFLQTGGITHRHLAWALLFCIFEQASSGDDMVDNNYRWTNRNYSHSNVSRSYFDYNNKDHNNIAILQGNILAEPFFAV